MSSSLALPLIQFAHGNGFPAASYRTLFTHLKPYQVRYIARFGHEKKAYYPRVNWGPLVDQFLSHLRRHSDANPCIALGHSIGAAIILQAYFKRPHAFKRLILMDPPFFNPLKRAAIRLAAHLGLTAYLVPPARKTKRRRIHFKSIQEAEQTLAKKDFFNAFHPQAFKDYIQNAFIPHHTQIKLAFDKQIEYQIYKTLPFKLQTSPIHIRCDYLYSTQYEVVSLGDIRYLRKQFHHVQFIPFQGSHMFPLEKPEETARCIKHLLLDD